jgi:RNA-directed DNA polymerase
MTTLIEHIASDETVDQAYAWLCKKRSHYHHNNDVWQVRRWWPELKPRFFWGCG